MQQPRHITSQMIRDLVYLSPAHTLTLHQLYDRVKATSCEDRATVLTLLKISGQSHRIDYNESTGIISVSEEQFTSCR